MKLSGTYKMKVAREKVWIALNDPAVLKHCTPGCKEMTVVAEELPNVAYTVLMEVGVGNIKGSYTGKIQISDQVPGSQYKLAVTGNGSSGFVMAEGLIQLADEGEETLVNYSGQAQVGGLVAGVGQRLIEGVAKLIVGRFFKCFETTILKSDVESAAAVVPGPDSPAAI